MAQLFYDVCGCCCWPYMNPRRQSDYNFKTTQNGQLASRAPRVVQSEKDVNAHKDTILEIFRKFSSPEEEIDAQQLRDLLNSHFRQGKSVKGRNLRSSFRSNKEQEDIPSDQSQLPIGFLSTEFVFSGFSLDLSRSMVAMHDRSMDGRLDIEEFREVWKDLHRWKDAFMKHDVQRKGYFLADEFEDILKDIGLQVNEDTIKALRIRFSDRAGHVRFDDFISCAVRLKLMIETFNDQKDSNSDTAQFSGEEFFQLAYS